MPRIAATASGSGRRSAKCPRFQERAGYDSTSTPSTAAAVAHGAANRTSIPNRERDCACRLATIGPPWISVAEATEVLRSTFMEVPGARLGLVMKYALRTKIHYPGPTFIHKKCH